jgi:hypothetical protein
MTDTADSAKPARPKRKARAKRSGSKANTGARDLIASAAHELGGAERLVAWARQDAKNEAVFWGTLYAKLIPLPLAGDEEGPIQHELSIRFV